MGAGGGEMEMLFSLLDLPHQKLFEKSYIKVIGDDVGCILCKEAKESMMRAIQKEIEMALEEKHNTWENKHFFDNTLPGSLTYEKWKAIPEADCPKVPIIISFDMGFIIWACVYDRM
eukprot:10970352-Ditylum_brightwellii.AAC.1